MKIAIGCDHAGYELKEKLKEHLEGLNHVILDCGTYSETSVDYPDFGHAVGKEINSNNIKLGVLICGSGNGISMVANKYKNVRAALCWTPEIAELAIKHNNANILALPARYITDQEGLQILNTFLSTEFEGGRHERRVNKISCV
ncbi:MAG: ribose 5-phosphate isomerase B [Crocinitomicaceae bacterium]|jgi:ribose 5-phosphate isomerase B|nr:ribose 5-phosphate isomerase B [Crocinitomicaceae bacterium]